MRKSLLRKSDGRTIEFLVCSMMRLKIMLMNSAPIYCCQIGYRRCLNAEPLYLP
jgi:hypothetical protein